jgi:beta-xylosidase
MKKILLLAVLMISISTYAKSMLTYTNPVLRGFFPDPSTIRVGNDYYTINSTFQYFPALAISHSKDLAHWEQVSYVFNDDNPIDLTHFYDGCGLWAPDISYYDREYYVFYCLVQLKKDRSVNGHGNVHAVNTETKGITSTSLYLRVSVNGLRRSFYYSYDGKQWNGAGTIADASYLSDEGTPNWGFMGTMVGMYALNYGSGLRVAADFDDFVYSLE